MQVRPIVTPPSTRRTPVEDDTIVQERPKAKRTRAYERAALARAIRLTLVDMNGHQAGSWDAQTLDLSRNGIGIRSSRPLVVGDRLVIDIGRGTNARRLFGIVRRITQQEARGYTLGVSFEAMPREVSAWASQPAPNARTAA